MQNLLKKPLILAMFAASTTSLSAVAANDLIISEYIEGSSNNKAIELYNTSATDIDLSSYKLAFYFNGKTTVGTTIALNGIIPANGTFVVADNDADAAILSVADQVSTASFFNGDDAIVLSLNDGTVVDSLGQVGEDPGAEWGTGDTSTKDNTLYRVNINADIDPFDAFDPAQQWDGAATNTFADLGTFGDSGSTDPSDPVEPNPQPEPVQLVKIHDIQGATDVSPLEGQQVAVEAVVTAITPGLGGFFIQEEAADYDALDSTSEGVFVYGDSTGVSVGDKVQITATVAEYYNFTELKNVTNLSVVDSGNSVVATAVMLPFASLEARESLEGMLVSFAQTLTVTENYNLGRYGELVVSSGGRLMNPTNVVAPGADAIAMQEANNLNRILIDDLSTKQNPETVIYPAPELSADNTVRSGYEVSNLQGVVSYSFDEYRVQPTVTPNFDATNYRTAMPDSVGGSLKVASFNVLNYFNGDGQGAGFPTPRGANTLEEFERQQAKIVAAITAMDADIIGLMEIENDGYDTNSAIASLVDALNAEVAEARYAFIHPGVAQIGTDEIAVGIIYNQQTVTPKGNAAILDSSVDARFIDDKNRPALAQSFAEIANNGILTVAVNHLKSKGSSCDAIGDPDTGDLQGNCNLTRTAAAEALVDWLANDPTNSGDSDRLIIGDLNAYAMEDPITAIKTAGYSDLIKELNGDGYSYIFFGQAGYLDHALASTDLQSQVTGVTEWHINTDEPKVLDYNTEYKTDAQQITYYSADAYRSSDHDPVVIGLNLEPSAQFVYADNIAITSKRANLLDRKYTATITVIDDLGQPVANADVSGVWQGQRLNQTASCTTNEEGICKVTLTTRSYNKPDQFTVQAIDAEGLSFDANSSDEAASDISTNDNLIGSLQTLLARLLGGLFSF